MKFILCGKNDVAVHALDHMLACGDEVWAVGTAGDDGRDGWQLSFRAAAERAGVRFDQPCRINDPAFAEKLRAFGARALVSIQYDQILGGALLRGLPCPALNLHFSLLPRHRGVAPIAWAILCGDSEAGATLHQMVVDIDAGELVEQRRVPIHPDDSARDLYERVSDAAGALFEASHPFPDELLRARRAQTGEDSYHPAGAFDFSRRAVDWKRDVRELQRWLRAMIFPPHQLPEARLGGRTLRIERVGAEVGSRVDAPPGSVVAVHAGVLEVAAGSGTVRLVRVVDPDGSDASVGVAVGDVFEGAGD